MPFRTALALAAALAGVALSEALAQTELKHPDPIVMMPDQITWTGNPDGAQGATVFGDPRKAGPFIFIVNWTSNSISKPHYHTKTRTLIVLKGHWDFGSGPHYDLGNMKAIPEGGVVIVPAGGILYDGCKQPPCMVEIVGDGDDEKFMVDENGRPLPSPEPTPADTLVRTAPRFVEGLPIETGPPEKADDQSLFPQQTRAPYHKAADYTVATITNKLHLPWSMAFLPDGKFLVTEKEHPGALRIVDRDGTISAPITGLGTLAAPGKLGLLDVALDPNFAGTKRVFLTFFERLDAGYSNTNVAHAVLDETAGALRDVTVIFRAIPASPAKNFSLKQGGRIAVAKDGSLFLTIGDRDVGTPWMVAQQPDNDLGKIIHITPEGLPAADNPYLKTPGALPEIWAIGMRSQQGLAFDPQTGHLWETEHGPRGGDELNLIERGRNYGWPIITHGIDYSGVPIGEGLTAKEGMEQPVYYWDPVIAPSGLAFYQGSLFPQWRNSVFVGGLRGRLLDRLELKDDKVVAEEPLLTELSSRIRDVRVGPDGAVYVLTESDRLLKLTPK